MTIAKPVKQVQIRADLKIEDMPIFLEHASAVTNAGFVDTPDAICEGVCNPKVAPLDAGYEILLKICPLIDGKYALIIDCAVFDEGKLFAEACKCYKSCWGDALWMPGSVEEALYEVLVASNANPAPCDIGIELSGFTAPKVPTRFEIKGVGAVT